MATKKKPSRAAANKSAIQFKESDLPYLVAVLDTKPDLKVCALAVKRAREINLKYPVRDLLALKSLMGTKEVVVENHTISLATMKQFFAPEEFPIENEEQLISRIHMALIRGRGISSFAGMPFAHKPSKTKKK